MLDLYESNRHVASIPFNEVLDMGVRCFFQVQEILGRTIVLREDENGTDSQSTIRVSHGPGSGRAVGPLVG